MLMMPSVSIMVFSAAVVAVGLVIAWYLGGIVPVESSNVKPLTVTTGHNDDDGFRKVA